MFSRVLVRSDFSAYRMQPFIAIGVIEVPMRVNQVLDRIAAEGIERIGDPSSGTWDTGIDEKFSIAPVSTNISLRTFRTLTLRAAS
jgi:hypothetical protein